MKIIVKVKPNAKEEKVVQISDGEYAVWVKAPPKEGKANDAIVAVLSDYFSVPKSRITILKGATSRLKVIDVTK